MPAPAFSLVSFEWFVPRFNFVTFQRAPGFWAAKHQQSERVSFRWTPAPYIDAVVILVPDDEARTMFGGCYMSAEAMDERRKVRAWQATEIDPIHISELRTLRQHIARGVADPEHLRRAMVERDRLAALIEAKEAA